MVFDKTKPPKLLLSILNKQLAVPTKQSDVLSVIRYMMDVENATLNSKLTFSECDTLLRYFQVGCEAGNGLSIDNIKTLRRMPIFLSANGDQMRSICTDSNCHTVSSFDLPVDKIDSILSTAGCVLLKSNSMLDLLYRKLSIIPINTTVIFLKYILPYFDELDGKAKVTCVKYIRDKVLKKSSEEEQKDLYCFLKKIAFIANNDGYTHTADHYYDPANAVFKYMVDDGNILPKEFHTF